MPQNDQNRRSKSVKGRPSLLDKYISHKRNLKSSSTPFLNEERTPDACKVIVPRGRSSSSVPSCSSILSADSGIWGIPSSSPHRQALGISKRRSTLFSEEHKGQKHDYSANPANARSGRSESSTQQHDNDVESGGMNQQEECKESELGDDDDVYYSAVDEALDGVTLNGDAFRSFSSGSASLPDQINTNDGKGSDCLSWLNSLPSRREGSLEANNDNFEVERERDTRCSHACASKSVEKEKVVLNSQVAEHKRILPPHILPTPKQAPLPLHDFRQLLGHKIELFKVRTLARGNGTSRLEVVRSISRQNNGIGLKKNSVWVLKRFKTKDVALSDSIRALTQLKRECEVYKRIAGAPKEGKAGFGFIMTVVATITFTNEHCLLLPLMTTDLARFMDNWKALPKQDIRRIIAQTSIGIATLHSIGIIHGDIKPANIFIDVRGNIKIGDFGLSYLTPALGPLNRDTIYTARELGTIGYMAPEKTKGTGYSYPVDYWSLGCIFCEMVGVEGWILDLFEDREEIEAWAEGFSEAEERKLFFADQGLDSETLDLLCGLLDPNPRSRMEISDLIAHDFFKTDEDNSEFSDMSKKASEGWQIVPVKSHKEKSSSPSIYISEPSDDTVYRWINPYGPFVSSLSHLN